MLAVMIDLETLGNGHNAVISTFAAVLFDLQTGAVMSQFYHRIDAQSCVSMGMEFDASTINFWLSQGKEATHEITCDPRKHISEVLVAFSEWCNGLPKDTTIWSNGIHFDLVILKSAYIMCMLNAPWDFRNERDVRTLVAFAPDIKKVIPFTGVKHHALHDCIYQSLYCSVIYNAIVTNMPANLSN